MRFLRGCGGLSGDAPRRSASRSAVASGSAPVALERRGTSANQVGVMLFRLPVRGLRSGRHLRLIAEQTRRDEAGGTSAGHPRADEGSDRRRILDRVAGGSVLLRISSPTCPARPLLPSCGAPLTAIWPVAVLGDVRSGVAAVLLRGPPVVRGPLRRGDILAPSSLRRWRTSSVGSSRRTACASGSRRGVTPSASLRKPMTRFFHSSGAVCSADVVGAGTTHI